MKQMNNRKGVKKRQSNAPIKKNLNSTPGTVSSRHETESKDLDDVVSSFSKTANSRVHRAKSILEAKYEDSVTRK